VSSDEVIAGNKMADQMAKLGPEHLFIGPEPACSISIGTAKKGVWDWTNRTHRCSY
jgi:hypothetical protein